MARPQPEISTYRYTVVEARRASKACLRPLELPRPGLARSRRSPEPPLTGSGASQTGSGTCPTGIRGVRGTEKTTRKHGNSEGARNGAGNRGRGTGNGTTCHCEAPEGPKQSPTLRAGAPHSPGRGAHGGAAPALGMAKRHRRRDPRLLGGGAGGRPPDTALGQRSRAAPRGGPAQHPRDPDLPDEASLQRWLIPLLRVGGAPDAPDRLSRPGPRKHTEICT